MDAREDRPPSPAGGQRSPPVKSSDSDEEEEFFDALAAHEDDGVPVREEDGCAGETEAGTGSAVGEKSCRAKPTEFERPCDTAIQADETTAAWKDNYADSTDEGASSDSEAEGGPTERHTLSGDADVRSATPASGEVQDESHEGLKAEATEEEEEKKAEETGDNAIDEEALRELEEQMTEEEKVAKRQEAQKLKADGNELFKNEEFADAVYAYSQALRQCPLSFKKDRSIMYANRAACKVKQENLDGAIEDCTKALELNPLYLKVVLRRAKAYELTDKLDESLKDYQRALELDPGCHEARAACMRLPDQIQERNEKLKAEMMSKLKDLGNLCLRPFGLSTDNFQLNQDPSTGSYSVNFQQNPGTAGN